MNKRQYKKREKKVLSLLRAFAVVGKQVFVRSLHESPKDLLTWLNEERSRRP